MLRQCLPASVEPLYDDRILLFILPESVVKSSQKHSKMTQSKAKCRAVKPHLPIDQSSLEGGDVGKWEGCPGSSDWGGGRQRF